MKASPQTSNNTYGPLIEKMINIDDLIEITPSELEKLRNKSVTSSVIKRVTQSPGKDSRVPTESMIEEDGEYEQVNIKEAKKEYYSKKQYFLPDKNQSVKRLSIMVRAKSRNTVKFVWNDVEELNVPLQNQSKICIEFRMSKINNS